MGFTESLRFELAPQNIQCSVILPGVVKTEIWHRTRESANTTLQQMSAEQAELYHDNLVSVIRISEKVENNGMSQEKAALVFKKVL
ncbi:SDR family NAD(P)-dependent oxidoreductase [Haliscomenobacter hydrossis]|uniref:SDR family NAD(P)-dependent oxidoreductase n=1 Tax=Haliscomenobacter hydrossis TaxID=2350 RepID=UPI0005C4B26E